MDDVLLKDALELISNREPAFYSRLFLVKKASGGWKHMMDLLPLSTFMALKNFKIETVISVLASLMKGMTLSSP